LSRRETGAPIDRLTELVTKEWPRWLGSAAPSLEWVLESTARPTAQTSVILYAIDSSTRQPTLVAKVSRDPRFGFVVRQESERSNEARLALGPGQEKTVPCPFGLIQSAQDLYLISEYAPEGLRWDRLAPAARAPLTDRLAAWLADLHGRSERPIRAVDLRHPELIVKTYIEVFQPPDPVGKRLQHAAESVSAEFASSSTEILVHGDFWPGNWRMNGGGFTIIDWENAHWSPSPLADEFLYPLSDLTLGREEPEHDLFSFSETYRRHRGLPLRRRDEAELASIWNAAEVATRTHRRWGVVEDWALEWHRAVVRLAMR
jgi:aminoglycoside phosphotransferase (APT) family kinase protein